MTVTHLDGARAHRRLRLILRDHRRRVPLTQREVATSLDWSVSKVVRIENGDILISPSDAGLLLDLYTPEASATAREELLGLARKARQHARQQPWRAFRDVYPPAYLRFLSYEPTAQRIWYVEPIFIPGILQTHDYATALAAGTQIPRPEPEVVARLRQAHALRLEMLADRTPHVIAYIDESAVRRAVGGPRVIRDQLEHLEELANLDHVTIRVVPLTAGAYPGIHTGFVRLQFDDEPDVLFIEGLPGDVMLREDPQGASTRGSYHLPDCVQALQDLDAIALPEAESVAFIRTLADSINGSKSADSAGRSTRARMIASSPPA